MNGPDSPHRTTNSCFGASRSVWVHLAMFRYYTKLGAKRVELVQLMHKFVPWRHLEFFATNAPDPLHWTLNSCIATFRSLWVVHFGLFRYCTKLDAKRVELVQLMQKFLPRSPTRILSQRMHPIHPIGPSTNVLLRFIPFGCIWDR